jgi:hypothetical protein
MPNSQPRVIRRARKKVNLYLNACATKVVRIKCKMARQSSLSLRDSSTGARSTCSARKWVFDLNTSLSDNFCILWFLFSVGSFDG